MFPFLTGDSESFTTPVPKVLDFDIEVRPLGWYGGDWVHKEITVISSAWVDDPEGTMQSHTLKRTRGADSYRKMLRGFVKRYNEADVVVGHYIRGFDLPTLNGAMLDAGMPPLKPKRTQDTKSALVKFQGLSKSQENLASILGVPSPKIGMNQQDWREANRLNPDGIEYACERCEGDVLQNIEMRRILLERGFLGAPELWTPEGT